MVRSAVYATANLSGGHITPTVTIATMITGHITILKGLAYVLAQLVGSVFGSLLIVRTFLLRAARRKWLSIRTHPQAKSTCHSCICRLCRSIRRCALDPQMS